MIKNFPLFCLACIGLSQIGMQIYLMQISERIETMHFQCFLDRGTGGKP
jgi:hypothetical protein